MEYYDGTKLLSLKDINGNTPEIYICTTNRSAGKTTYFNRLCVNKFLKNGEKFAILYRYKYELDDCADKFFKDIKTLFFNDYNMTAKKFAKGLFSVLYLNDKPCGYALPLNGADQLKKFSHFLSDTKRIVFDEFQTETNTYCKDEVKKFISIHTSIARGNGEVVRYVPVYMISNPITLLNPYYVSMKIAQRLNDKTKYLKGDGFVLEQGYLDTVAQLQLETPFNRAFADDKYIAYSSTGVYLNDNATFIDKPTGKFKYIATVKYMNNEYSIKEYPHIGCVYCDDSYDKTFPLKLSLTINDHDINYMLFKEQNVLINVLKQYFNRGLFRFKNVLCKEVIMNLLSY